VFSGYLTGRGDMQARPPGPFRTGDLGYFDPEGYVFFTGRKKELIIKGGVKISPLEITACLCQHPAVFDAATVGVPDRIYGESVACFVVPKPGANVTQDALREHLKSRLSEFKMPSSLTFVDAIPRTDRQKVSRELLLRYWEEHVLPARGAGVT
jgi:long-chain acyl-CoA synthetase